MEQSHKLLVVEDDPSASDWLAMFAARLGYEVEVVGSGEAAVEALRRGPVDLVTLDVLLPGMNGIETLKALKQVAPRVPVIMLSGHGQTQTIVEAVRSGASDFLRKPFEPEQLELAFAKALSHGPDEDDVAKVRAVPPPAGPPSEPVPEVFGRGLRMRHVQEVIDRVADTDITVLVCGESGTGKELVARSIHEKSGRNERPYVKVNCAALPSELLESELFGYEKGAFTGAQRRKLGKFEVANTGTILLDEISEMNPALQAKLLQVLQDGQFARLGGQGDVKVDARVIAATNRDLESSVREGRFREDLFYRLNVVTVQIPPLRERRDEIPVLTEYFLRRYSDAYDKEYAPISELLEERFLAYPWPGNIRELENLVKRMVVLGAEQPVIEELLSRRAASPPPRESSNGKGELERFMSGEVDRVSLKRIGRDAAQAAERRLIEKVLHRTRWNRKEAAEVLQISYKALLYKMRDAGLSDRA